MLSLFEKPIQYGTLNNILSLFMYRCEYKSRKIITFANFFRVGRLFQLLLKNRKVWIWRSVRSRCQQWRDNLPRAGETWSVESTVPDSKADHRIIRPFTTNQKLRRWVLHSRSSEISQWASCHTPCRSSSADGRWFEWSKLMRRRDDASQSRLQSRLRAGRVVMQTTTNQFECEKLRWTDGLSNSLQT